MPISVVSTSRLPDASTSETTPAVHASSSAVRRASPTAAMRSICGSAVCQRASAPSFGIEQLRASGRARRAPRTSRRSRPSRRQRRRRRGAGGERHQRGRDEQRPRTRRPKLGARHHHHRAGVEVRTADGCSHVRVVRDRAPAPAGRADDVKPVFVPVTTRTTHRSPPPPPRRRRPPTPSPPPCRRHRRRRATPPRGERRPQPASRVPPRTARTAHTDKVLARRRLDAARAHLLLRHEHRVHRRARVELLRDRERHVLGVGARAASTIPVPSDSPSERPSRERTDSISASKCVA